MESVDAEVDGSAFACFDDLFLDLFAYFSHNLLDACGVDASVSHKLMQRKASYLAAHGVEPRKHYRLWSVVDYDLDACGGFERADIAAFASDDASFYLVGVNLEHRHGVLDGCFGRHTLYRLDYDALGFLVGGHFRIVHDVVDVACCGSLCFILEALHKLVFCLFGGQTADMLQLFLRFL